MEPIVYNKSILPDRRSGFQRRSFHETTFSRLTGIRLLGFLLRQLAIPIPYLLGGIITGFVVRTFLDNSFQWPRAWRG